MKCKLQIFFAGLLFAAQPSQSHHNFAAHYDPNQIVTISGVVSRFRFVNPHARVYIDVEDENGVVTQWMAEGDASVALRRAGWVATMLEPGDQIEVVGNPARNGSNMLGWSTIRIADGTELGGGDGQVELRLQILNESLARFRDQRGQ